MAVEMVYRPLVSKWPKIETPWRQRRAGDWKFTGLAQWLAHLESELARLKVREALVEVDADPVNFKKYGGLFADAKTKSPKVMLTFDLPDVGTVVYACDNYKHYEDNLHAIGLTLERLRLVDNYGATTGREQYRGFKRLPPAGGTSEERDLTPLEAAEVLIGFDPSTGNGNLSIEDRSGFAALMVKSAGVAHTVARQAVKATHPDTGGDPNDYAKVARARTVLQKHHGGADV